MNEIIKTTSKIFAIIFAIFFMVVFVWRLIIVRQNFPVYEVYNFSNITRFGKSCTSNGTDFYYSGNGEICHIDHAGETKTLLTDIEDIKYLRANEDTLYFYSPLAGICSFDLSEKELINVDVEYRIQGMALSGETLFAEMEWSSPQTKLLRFNASDLTLPYKDITEELFSDVSQSDEFTVRKDDLGYEYLYAGDINNDEIRSILAVRDMSGSVIYSRFDDKMSYVNFVAWVGSKVYIEIGGTEIVMYDSDNDFSTSIDIPDDYYISPLNVGLVGNDLYFLAQKGTTTALVRYNFPIHRKTQDAILKLDMETGMLVEVFSVNTKKESIAAMQDGEAVCFNKKGELYAVSLTDKKRIKTIGKIKKGKEMVFESCGDYLFVSSDGHNQVFSLK